MKSYKITLENGHSYDTSMAAGVTLEEAKNYFLGKMLNIGFGEHDKMVKCVNVEENKAPGFYDFEMSEKSDTNILFWFFYAALEIRFFPK